MLMVLRPFSSYLLRVELELIYFFETIYEGFAFKVAEVWADRMFLESLTLVLLLGIAIELA